MPKKIIEFTTEEGELILVEALIPNYRTTRGGTEEDSTVESAKGGSFRRAISTVKSVSKEVISVMKNAEVRPDEIEVKLSLKAMTGSGNLWNFVLVKAQGEGTLEFKMTWKSAPDKKEV